MRHLIDDATFARGARGPAVRYKPVQQARRQDLAAGGGVKTRREGLHFKNTVLDVCSNRGAKREMGGPGTTAPPAGDGPAV